MDLDDLLEDVPDQKIVSKQLVRAKTAAAPAKKADDGWGDLGMDDEVKSTGGFGDSARNSNKGNMNKQPSFGFGGENGLKKEPKKKSDDEDEWGLDNDNRKPKNGGGFGGSRLLGRKPKREDNDDDLDTFLDDIE